MRLVQISDETCINIDKIESIITSKENGIEIVINGLKYICDEFSYEEILDIIVSNDKNLKAIIIKPNNNDKQKFHIGQCFPGFSCTECKEYVALGSCRGKCSREKLFFIYETGKLTIISSCAYTPVQQKKEVEFITL